MVAIALTVAGSDPSGGAGLQADLKSFHAFGVYGASVVTLVTVQNTVAVTGVHVLPRALVESQLEAVLTDLDVGAAKTGALGSAEVVDAVASAFARRSIPLVVDPVMISKHGTSLLDELATIALRERLLPRAWLVTPNAPEAAALSGRQVTNLAEAREAARAIADLGAANVLVKGGHLDSDRSVDVLLANGDFHEFDAPRVRTRAGHGTGCTLSAAITAGLSRGDSLVDSVARAKRWVTLALENAEPIGHGIGPLNHAVRVP